MSLLSELHPCLHHCPSPLYPFDLIHQNTYLCRSPFCHTPAFPIAPFPFLCLLFLSTALSLVSSLLLCHPLFFLLFPPLFFVCYFCWNYSFLNVSSLSAKFLSSLKLPPLLCSFDFFHQTLMKPHGKVTKCYSGKIQLGEALIKTLVYLSSLMFCLSYAIVC